MGQNPAVVRITVHGDLDGIDIDTPMSIVEKIVSALQDSIVIGVPILMSMPKTASFLDIDVTVTSEDANSCYNVVFRMLRDNMYLIAFRSGKYPQLWWELKDSSNDHSRNPIPGSQKLQLTESYTGNGIIGSVAKVQKLVRDASNPHEGPKYQRISYRHALVLNMVNFVKHMNFLYYYKKEKSEMELANSLMFMAQFLAKMPRFKRICEHVQNQWLREEVSGVEVYGEEMTTNKATRLSDELITLQNNWQTHSSEVHINRSSDSAAELGVALKVDKRVAQLEKGGPSRKR